MVDYMDQLSVTEAENLKKTIAALFRQTCILQVKYDPVTLIARDNPHYEICVRHRKFIEDYLAVVGCEMIHDPQERVFRLIGEGVETERLTLTVTKVMLLIRLIYRDKVMGDGLHATVTNLEEIRKYGKETNLIDYKLTIQEWRQALYVMSKHQILEAPGAIRDVDDQTPLYIYSTINLYCSGMDIQKLLQEYLTEEIDESAADKSELTMQYEDQTDIGGEEDAAETGEEDIYTHGDE